jgi:acetoin utilization protein AcuB
MMETVRVRDVMTPLPLPIHIEDTLADAHSRMLQLEVRHLPVLSGTRIVGMLSERDVALAQGLGMGLETVSVGAAMSAGPFTVQPDEALDAVLQVMAEKKFGSAVVVQGERLVGVFTSTDALRLLSWILANTATLAPIELPQSSVLQRLQKEQAVLHSIREAARHTALAALKEDDAAIDQLPNCIRGLHEAVLRYTELEEELLLPLLAQTSASGAVRAELLRERHQRARRQIHMAHLALRGSDPEHLASAVLSLCEA